MKIGIDASRANLTEKTGTEWYSFYVIEELKKIIPNNHQVVLYSKESLKDPLSKLPANWQSKVLSWPPKFLWTQFRLSWEMMKFWSRPDMLFIPAHTIPLIHPAKTVVVAHDIGFEKAAELYDKKSLNYHRWAMRFAIKNAYKIITVSNFSKKEIIDFYKINEKKIFVSHNGFNSFYHKIHNKENDYAQAFLRRYGIKKPYILFVGRLEQKKNVPKLIEAFAILKNKYKSEHQLVLVGMPGFKYQDIKNNIQSNNLSQAVIETGYLTKENLNILMNLSDVFVLPSLYEGFGIPILEAMSVGIPVACSKIPPLIEVGNDAANYFDPNNKYEMAEKIYKNITDLDYRKKLIDNGYKNIQKFSFNKCALLIWQAISN
jgi:glycosyltransferase involved in cell wall biosynthesis